jgi:hypothetical protein
MVSTLHAGFLASGLSLSQLWFSYFGLGGNATQLQLGRFVSGEDDPGAHEHDLIAHALNERFHDLDLDSPVAYSNE